MTKQHLPTILVYTSPGLSPYEMLFGRPARISIEVELGIPLQNPSTQSVYTQSLSKAIQIANQTVQKNLLTARHKQASQYAQGHPAWKPFAAGQTVWFSRPKKWKFGKKWIGPYKISSQNEVNYLLRSTIVRSLVAHHNQLRLCPTPLGQGSPVQLIAEAPEILLAEPEGVGGQEVHRVAEGTARPPRFRKIISPPLRLGDFVTY